MVKSIDAEREEGSEEEGVALREVVVPGIAAVEDGQRLRDVEIEKAEGRKGPLVVVNAVHKGRDGEYEGSDKRISPVQARLRKGASTRKALLPQPVSFSPLKSPVR